ncbi:MAG: hypothetical protein Q9173_005085 [Seirophora scorigena]
MANGGRDRAGPSRLFRRCLLKRDLPFVLKPNRSLSVDRGQLLISDPSRHSPPAPQFLMPLVAVDLASGSQSGISDFDGLIDPAQRVGFAGDRWVLR